MTAAAPDPRELACRVRQLRRVVTRDPETFATAVESVAEQLDQLAHTAAPIEATPTSWRAPERQVDDPQRERRLAALLAEQDRQIADLRAKLAAARRRRRGRRGGRRGAGRADASAE
jgi:hypothetical protein